MNEQEHYREGKIVIIEAPQRAGKTLTMSILAYEEYYNNHAEILTNIAYENPITKQLTIPYKPLNFFELTMEKIGVYKNRAITIDELNFYLDSRGSMTKVNKRFCQWLLQSKKMGIDTYGTTHGLHYLDLRFRENFDFLVQPQTYYQDIIDDKGNTIKKPIGLKMRWFNGPNQKSFRKTITIDFRQKPKLLGMYNTRNTFNPFAEMEEHMEQEKKEKRIKKNYSALAKVVPDWQPAISRMNPYENGVDVGI